MIEFKYRPDVDGLRAVAVTSVLLFHVRMGFPGGYIGVDVFFVISGFLITGLILKEQAAGTFTLRNFWVRRVSRIIPAASVMVIAALIAGFFLLLPHDYADLGKSTIAQQLIISNVYFWQNTGYFDGPADLKPLLHTWSLAVEEQFYLGYPFLLVFLMRFQQRTIGTILAVLAIVSLGASQFGVAHHPSATFFLLPTRAWELLMGGLICFIPAPTRVNPFLLNLISWLSLGGILAASWIFTSTTSFPGINALLPCGATALLIYANSSRHSFPARLLAARPVVFVGLISYSLYLWHWPILAYVRYRVGEDLGPMIGCAALLSTALVAVVSWRFIEIPIRKRTFAKRDSVLVGSALAGMLAVCLFCNALRSDGFRWRYSREFLDIVEVPYAGDGRGAVSTQRNGWELPVIGNKSTESGKPRFVLWGDSYAKCISIQCDEVARDYGVQGYDAGLGGTPPLLHAWTGTENREKAESFNEFVLEFSAQERIKWLILFAGWDIHINGISHLRDGKAGSCFDVFERSFEATIARAESHGMKVAVILQPPYQRESVPPVVARDVLRGSSGAIYGVSQARHAEYRAKSVHFFSTFGDRIKLVDASDDCFGENGMTVIGRDGIPYYSDAGHPSRAGVRVFFDVPLRKLFSEIAGHEIAGQSLSEKPLRPGRQAADRMLHRLCASAISPEGNLGIPGVRQCGEPQPFEQ
ncbi:MAG TPA: acyltransferase family protein [Planctomycetaceae bacterium]|jgi:peptidoglycan/LPS O-acetylase OafA/YrhL